VAEPGLVESARRWKLGLKRLGQELVRRQSTRKTLDQLTAARARKASVTVCSSQLRVVAACELCDVDHDGEIRDAVVVATTFQEGIGASGANFVV
jgi:hypothetical protein